VSRAGSGSAQKELRPSPSVRGRKAVRNDSNQQSSNPSSILISAGGGVVLRHRLKVETPARTPMNGTRSGDRQVKSLVGDQSALIFPSLKVRELSAHLHRSDKTALTLEPWGSLGACQGAPHAWLVSGVGGWLVGWLGCRYNPVGLGRRASDQSHFPRYWS
jgi:hypothetical protein